MPRGDPLIRQWRLLIELNKGLRTLQQLSGLLQEKGQGVSKRTIQRDIGCLESAGFPVVQRSADSDGLARFRLVESYSLPMPYQLTGDEMRALHLAKSMTVWTPLYEACHTAVAKVLGKQPSLKTLLPGFSSKVLVTSRGAKKLRNVRGAFDLLSRAIEQRFTVSANYREQNGVVHALNVDPYRLWFVDNALYLIGYELTKRELRTLAIERIESPKITNRHFEPLETCTVTALTDSAFSASVGEAKLVRIRFSPDMAGAIREREWHPSQRIFEDPDGFVVLDLTVADLDEVKKWLLGWGADAEVLEPVELRERILQECRAVVKVYAPGDNA